MDNLARFDSDGIEIFVNEKTGESFASIKGIARMAGKSPATIRKFIGGNQIDVINAEVETEGGLQGGNLLSESSICKVLVKYNPDRLVQFAELGIRTALHKIAGYRSSSTFTESKPKSLLDLNTTQLYQLAAYKFAIEGGIPKDPDLIRGIDPVYLEASGEAAQYAYFIGKFQMAEGTKRANDALREIGYFLTIEKEIQKELKDIAHDKKYLAELEAGMLGRARKSDFDRFESQQIALAGNKSLVLQGT